MGLQIVPASPGGGAFGHKALVAMQDGQIALVGDGGEQGALGVGAFTSACLQQLERLIGMAGENEVVICLLEALPGSDRDTAGPTDDFADGGIEVDAARDLLAQSVDIALGATGQGAPLGAILETAQGHG